MAREITPSVPALPSTSAIADPAARRFAESVIQALHSIDSAEFATQAMVTALNNGLPSPPGGVAGDGQEYGIQQGMVSSILKSALYQALGRAIERIPVPRNISNKISALESGLTESNEVRKTEREMVVSQINAAVSRIGGAEAAIYAEAEIRASAIEATTTQIEGAVSRIGSVEAGVEQERTTRATNETAFVSAINTMWAMTGATEALQQQGGTVQTNWNAAQANWWNTLQSEVFTAGGQTIRQALAQEAQLRSNADGTLSAQYTVKIDQRGYVSGFGLASEATTTSAPRSSFFIRADRFAIGNPNVPILDPTNPPAQNIPFVVLTTTDADGNPPGVYMNDAFIKNAAIGTLQLEGEAVTVPRGAQGTSQASVTISVTNPDGIRALMIGTYTKGNGTVSGDRVGLFVGGSDILVEEPQTLDIGALTAIRFLGPGVHTLGIRHHVPTGDIRCAITVLGIKR